MENEKQNATEIETETCTRCGGSGHHSYCQMYGTTCFGCGGSGRRYTKRGAAAAAFLKSLRSKRLADFQPGDLFYMEPGPFSKGGFSKVTESGADKYNAGYWMVSTETLGGYAGSPDSLQRMGLNAEQKAATRKQALEYQATLTKAGTVRKQKGGKA